MESPFTGGNVTLLKEKKQFEFRKEFFDITQFYYKCEDTGEEFSTEHLDQIHLNQLYNQYRVRYGLPFPEQIKAIRTQYNLPASKISEILGLGINSYRQYENGDIPTIANGRLILAAKEPEELIKFLDASRLILKNGDYTKYIKIAQELIRQQKERSWDLLFSAHVFKHSKPSEFNGYKIPDQMRVAMMISYFSISMNHLFKTKLNKLLFYSDFLHFKKTGFSISGIAYRAIQMGPVPAEYDILYSKLVDDNLVQLEYVKFKNGYGEALSGSLFSKDAFLKTELDTMYDVAKKFGDKTTNQMVDVSHLELGWIANQEMREMISYQQYAFEITQI